MYPPYLRLSRIPGSGRVAASRFIFAVGPRRLRQSVDRRPPRQRGSPTAGWSSIAGGAAPVDSGPPIAVLGTENFYADLLTQIGGSRVTATSILNDPNADPHEFESSPPTRPSPPTPSSSSSTASATTTSCRSSSAPRTSPTGSSSTSSSCSASPDDVNVHIWYDPATMPKVAAAATDALSKLDPQNAPTSPLESRRTWRPSTPSPTDRRPQGEVRRHADRLHRERGRLPHRRHRPGRQDPSRAS